MSKPTIKLFFTDFWKGFNSYENRFTKILSPYYHLEISEKNPDFLIYSCFGNRNFRNYNCIRIFYTGENRRPNFRECDFALSFDFIKSERHYRLPNHRLRFFIEKNKNKEVSLTKAANIEKLAQKKTKFCSFLVSNPRATERIQFFNLLNQYKKVDSGGKVLNNIGFNPKDQLSFHLPYKFNICFENESYPGYTTEKILYAMLAGCVPIYWGDPLVHVDFNPRSFVNVSDFDSYESAIKHIIEIDQNEELYQSYLKEPYIRTDDATFLAKTKIVSFFNYIFTQKEKIQPIAKHPIFPILNEMRYKFKHIKGKFIR